MVTVPPSSKVIALGLGLQPRRVGGSSPAGVRRAAVAGGREPGEPAGDHDRRNGSPQGHQAPAWSAARGGRRDASGEILRGSFDRGHRHREASFGRADHPGGSSSAMV
jgi:hypothetical protein